MAHISLAWSCKANLKSFDRSDKFKKAAALLFSVCFLLFSLFLIFVSYQSDFEFSIIWGVNGNTSYNSETNRLIKSNMTADADKYSADLIIFCYERIRIKNIVDSIDLTSYPAEYNSNEGISGEPSTNFMLSVTENGKATRFSCSNILIYFESSNEKGQKFLSACKSIINILENTDKWKSLPEDENKHA